MGRKGTPVIVVSPGGKYPDFYGRVGGRLLGWRGLVRSVGVGPEGSGKVPVEGAAGGWRWRVPVTQGTSRERGDLPRKRGARRRQCAWKDSCYWKCEVGRKDLLVLGKVGFLEVKKLGCRCFLT